MGTIERMAQANLPAHQLGFQVKGRRYHFAISKAFLFKEDLTIEADHTLWSPQAATPIDNVGSDTL